MPESLPSGPILDLVKAVLTEDEWPLQQLEGQTVLMTEVADERFNWTCFACADEEAQQFIFYSVLPVQVPSGRYNAISEAITRANFGLPIGNFELDHRDGELRFKTSIDVEGTELNEVLTRTLVTANLTITRQYLPAMLDVALAAVKPIEAIDAAETL